MISGVRYPNGHPISKAGRVALRDREARKRARLLAGGFMDRADRSGGLFACWPWMGNRQTRPGKSIDERYGYFTVDSGRVVYAHRRSLELALGRALRPGMDAMHICDNPPCVNPAHLREGTRAENVADMIAKGRHRPRVAA